MARQNASQFARTAGAVLGESFLGKCVELARLRVPLNSGIELRGVESLEPRAKPRKLAGSELFNGLFDLFSGGHKINITPV